MLAPEAHVSATLSNRRYAQTGDGMKLLLFADLHLDTQFGWATQPVARAKRMSLREVLIRIVHLADAEQVDALACGGDLYEQDLFTPDTAAFLRQTFAQLCRPVYLAPGNHDWYGPQSLYHQTDWTPNVHVFTEASLRPVELAAGVTLWGAAHRAPANTNGFLDDFSVDRSGVNLALFHGSERSGLLMQGRGKAPHAPFHADQVQAAGFDHALLGHFHTPRSGSQYTYPGNPDPLTFGEQGDRGVVIVAIRQDGSVERTRHRLAVSQMHDVEVDLTDVVHAGDVRERINAALDGLAGVARVSLAGEVSPEVDLNLDDLQHSSGGLDEIVYQNANLRLGYDIDDLVRQQTVRGQFVRDVQAAPDLDEETRRRVLMTGLRALDRRATELAVY